MKCFVFDKVGLLFKILEFLRIIKPSSHIAYSYDLQKSSLMAKFCSLLGIYKQNSILDRWEIIKALSRYKKWQISVIYDRDFFIDKANDRLFKIVNQRESKIKDSMSFAVLNYFFSHKALWITIAKIMVEPLFYQQNVCRYIEKKCGEYEALYYYPKFGTDLGFLKEFPRVWNAIPLWYRLVMKIYQQIYTIFMAIFIVGFSPLVLLIKYGITFKKASPVKYDFVNEVSHCHNTVSRDTEWKHYTAFYEKDHHIFNKINSLSLSTGKLDENAEYYYKRKGIKVADSNKFKISVSSIAGGFIYQYLFRFVLPFCVLSIFDNKVSLFNKFNIFLVAISIARESIWLSYIRPEVYCAWRCYDAKYNVISMLLDKMGSRSVCCFHGESVSAIYTHQFMYSHLVMLPLNNQAMMMKGYFQGVEKVAVTGTWSKNYLLSNPHKNKRLLEVPTNVIQKRDKIHVVGVFDTNYAPEWGAIGYAELFSLYLAVKDLLDSYSQLYVLFKPKSATNPVMLEWFRDNPHERLIMCPKTDPYAVLSYVDSTIVIDCSTTGIESLSILKPVTYYHVLSDHNIPHKYEDVYPLLVCKTPEELKVKYKKILSDKWISRSMLEEIAAREISPYFKQDPLGKIHCLLEEQYDIAMRQKESEFPNVSMKIENQDCNV